MLSYRMHGSTLFGVIDFILDRILEGNTKRGTAMETRGSN